MHKKYDELQIPKIIKESKKANEIVRVWINDNKQTFIINPNVWDEPAAWGLLLVDLAKHIANAYSADKEINKNEVLQRIKQGFDVEWENPTNNI